MIGIIATHCFELSTTGRFLSQPVRVSTTQTGGAYCLVAINHYFIISSATGYMDVMVVHPLGRVVFITGDDITYVTGFHSMITIVYHELEGLIQLAFVVGSIGGCFVMHHHLHAFFFGVTLQLFNVEVGIGFVEEELTIFPVRSPVFPTFVPAFYQYSVDAMGGGKVDIFLHMGGIGGVMTIGFQFGIIRNAGFGLVEITICPGFSFACEHFPPHADEFHRTNPGGIFILARFVQIINQLRSKNVTGIIANNNGTPRRQHGQLQVTFLT